MLAVESIFLGKKSYIDRLSDEAGNHAYHIRLKGIPGKCIQYKSNHEYRGDAFKLFEELYAGDTVEFDVATGGNCVFKTNKNHSISTGKMTRKVCFADPDEEDE